MPRRAWTSASASGSAMSTRAMSGACSRASRGASFGSAVPPTTPTTVSAGHASQAGRARGAAAATKANVFVFPVSDGGDADGVGGLLREPPRFKLLALSDAARRGVVYEIDPSSSLIEELTAETLLDAVGARALS